jgi:hypothetical protein
LVRPNVFSYRDSANVVSAKGIKRQAKVWKEIVDVLKPLGI